MLKNININIFKIVIITLFFGISATTFSQKYVNDMDYVLGDVKQAFITNKITTEAKADNLLLGFKNMRVNGIRLPLFGRDVNGVDLNPNKPMFDYFYTQAVAQGFLIFANPAQDGGGARIANNMLNGEVPAVKNIQARTDELVNRVIEFSNEYPSCKWLNPFNEDGRATSSTWSVSQINEIYQRLYNHGLNGAELIGPCTWGIPAGIDMLQNTDISDYITVATTHNLGFNHSDWPTFINLAKAEGFPVWDSEVNHNDEKGTGTRLEKAIENKVDGLVLYNSWNTVSLATGGINATGETAMALYLAPLVNVALYGTATQSSVGYNGATSDKAIDGITDGLLASNSLSIISGTDTPPFWEVDLGSNKEIVYIKIYNRTDSCCKDRLENFTLYVSDSNGTTTYSKTYTSYPDPFVAMEVNQTGQVVRVESNSIDGTALNIAEVQIYEKNSVSWDGSVSADWTDGENWSSGNVPTLINAVTIPTGMPNQPIISGATGVELSSLTVISGATLTVESEGSLIVNTTSSGDVTYNLTVNDTNWHLLASPVIAETYNTAWVDANLIDNTTRKVGINIGIAAYNNTSDSDGDWVYAEDTDTGTFNSGQGYSIKRDATGSDISFTGTIQTASFSDAISANDIGGANENRWTLIGNPYPSYISITSLLTLSANATALEDNREAIYVFDNNKVGGAGYSATTTGYIRPGQGFFVNSNSASTSLTINRDMLSHQTAVTLYKNTDLNTSINLMISDGINSKSTEINYVEGTTTGLDPRFDIGTFNGVSSATAFNIYSQLVTNNLGVDFAKQSLPDANYENMIIPIGVSAVKGKEITFSVKSLNLPDGLKIFLEDRANNTFIHLDKTDASYKVTLSENIHGIGRFYMHTSSKSVLNTDSSILESVRVYKLDNTTLRVVGVSQGNTSVKLFSLLGKEIISTSFISKGVKDISLPKLATGIYIVQLETEKGKLNKKIIIE
jgi:hypothetical protein